MLRVDVGGAQEIFLGAIEFPGLARLLPGADEFLLCEIGAALRERPELLDGLLRPPGAVVQRRQPKRALSLPASVSRIAAYWLSASAERPSSSSTLARFRRASA